MMKNSIFVCAAILLVGASDHAQAANARGVGVNVPLVGRIRGGGNTLFLTAIDVTNNTNRAAQVDFYLDGAESSGGASVVVDGSISGNGQLVARGTGSPMRARSNAHYDDFIDELVTANLLPASVRTNGFVGSVLFVFDGFTRRGEGAATARFYSAFGGGFVSQALKGKEITNAEPQRLVAAVLDTRGINTGAPEMYPNMFINNTGLTPNGEGVAGPVTVEISAVSNTTGEPIGTPITIENIRPGRVATISQVLNVLQVPTSTERTILVFARVVSGNAAIHGLVSQIDNTTRDGAAFEMSPADF